MFAAGIGPQEFIIALVIILVLFGGSQIPKLARNLGRAQREFKDGIDEAQKSSNESSETKVTDTTSSETPQNTSS